MSRTAVLGQLWTCCTIMSGAMQGDPASGTLWALAMDPFLRDMRSRLRKHPGCEIGVCADDIGAT
eukprot:7981728-Pyramimonas_sp.AAC.1